MPRAGRRRRSRRKTNSRARLEAKVRPRALADERDGDRLTSARCRTRSESVDLTTSDDKVETEVCRRSEDSRSRRHQGRSQRGVLLGESPKSPTKDEVPGAEGALKASPARRQRSGTRALGTGRHRRNRSRRTCSWPAYAASVWVLGARRQRARHTRPKAKRDGKAETRIAARAQVCPRSERRWAGTSPGSVCKPRGQTRERGRRHAPPRWPRASSASPDHASRDQSGFAATPQGTRSPAT